VSASDDHGLHGDDQVANVAAGGLQLDLLDGRAQVLFGHVQEDVVVFPGDHLVAGQVGVHADALDQAEIVAQLLRVLAADQHHHCVALEHYQLNRVDG